MSTLLNAGERVGSLGIKGMGMRITAGSSEFGVPSGIKGASGSFWKMNQDVGKPERLVKENQDELVQ